MRFLTRSLLGLFLTAITIALLAVAGATLKAAVDIRNTDDGANRPAEERVFTARVTTLQPASIAPVMTAFGEVRTRRRLELRANAAGPIVDLAPGFADGTAVTAGQLLVRIDAADAHSALDLARTSLREAEAEVRDADRALALAGDDLAAAEEQSRLRAQALERQRGIAGRGLGVAADLETAELAMSNATQAVLSRRQALAAAEARVDKAATSLEKQGFTLAEAERRLTETELRAGFSGVLSGVTAVAGGLVAKNEKLGELIDPEALEVAFRVSTSQFARLIDSQGDLLPLPVTASLDVFGAELEAGGRLARVDAAVGEGASGRLVFATLDTARGFRPGDFVTLTVVEEPMDGVALIPARAIGGDGKVLVLGADERLEAIPAKMVRRQGDEVLIQVGALAGREIVLERTALLGEGIKMRPVRNGSASAGQGSRTAMIDLTPERRAVLITFVEENGSMPEEAKARVIAKLRADRVPLEMVERIEARMGG